MPPPAVSPMRPPPGESFQDEAIKSLVESARIIRAAQADLLSADGALGQHTKAITEVLERHHGLVLGELKTVNSKLDKLEGRVDTLEDREQGASNRLAALERDVAKMQRELGALTSRLDEFRGKHDTAQQAPAPTPG